MFTREPESPVALPAPRLGRRHFVVAAVLIVVLSGFWYLRSTSTAAPADTPTPAAAVAAPTAPVVPVGKPCGNTGTARAVTWTLIGHTPAPFSAAVGPAYTTPVRWCYAHTQQGALFAALNFVAQMETADPVVVAGYLMADGPVKQQVTAAAGMVTTPAPVNTSTDRMEWVGYHVIAQDKASTSIDVLHSWKGKLTAAAYTVLWQHGDWKLVYPDSLRFAQRQVPTVDPTYWHLMGNTV